MRSTLVGWTLLGIALAWPLSAEAASCLRIDSIKAFAPRGEVYVEVSADCGSRDFAGEDSLVAYLEVHTGGASTNGEDVRVYPDRPRRSQTFAFPNLEISTGDPLLVRLMRFGEILDLETVLVP